MSAQWTVEILNEGGSGELITVAEQHDGHSVTVCTTHARPIAVRIAKDHNTFDEAKAVLELARDYLVDRGIRDRGVVGRTKVLPAIDALLSRMEQP